MKVALQENFSGDIIKPGDGDYDRASTVLVAKGAPKLVLRPRSAADVTLAIQYGIEHSLVISVRSGGHSNGGFGTNKGGLVIDLMHLNGVEVIDDNRHLVRVGAGATWVKVAEALQEHGLAISSGDTKTVGVGGLTLGAGIGWMVRKYGLAIDNLVAAEVVMADGRVLRASESDHGDLFWAVRGGGGNMGVVTSFDFVAHPVANVYAGNVTYGLDDLTGLLKGWRDYMRTAPEDLTTMFMVMPDFGGMPPSAVILCCYDGDDKAAAMEAIDPLLRLGKVMSHDIAEKAYADVLGDAHVPSGVKIVVNNVFVQDFNDELIDIISRQKDRILQIRSLGGAMNRVPADATAFAHRDSEVLIVSPVFLAPDASDSTIEVALKPWREIVRFGTGAYSNFFSSATKKEVAAAYPAATYERLAEIKRRYDPRNVFNQNLNIKPAAASAPRAGRH